MTAHSLGVSREAQDLWLALQDVIKNEEAWPIIEAAFARVRGPATMTASDFRPSTSSGNPSET
jgi:hypothetical protein